MHETHECCECYSAEGGADTEVSGRRYTPPHNSFKCYVTKLRLYFCLYHLYSCTGTGGTGTGTGTGAGTGAGTGQVPVQYRTVSLCGAETSADVGSCVCVYIAYAER